jgi:hypothetical protein
MQSASIVDEAMLITPPVNAKNLSSPPRLKRHRPHVSVIARPPQEVTHPKPESAGLSQYELQREANIASNTQLVKPTDGLSKRDLAMLKLPIYKRTREHEVLWAIEDLIGPCSSWPDRERQIYWMKKLNHRDALRVVTFGLGNGLPPHLIFEWLRVREVKVHWPDFHNDMQLIQKIMELEEPIDKFYYDLRAKEWCFMNGLPRNAITKKVKGRKTEQGTKASLPSP